ncbi:TPA: hypothetical protein ACPZOZ_001956 [Yersinia enterocolitica]|uniref:hypothetical protein n=1 Tax=Yersinia enterocolitica TaxID=630 RepID=UPI002AC6B009|nr:hypothetical protein [Yersinia enterocolitica]HDL6771863.1 hypothetical protein [Yersinia enterocolitica]HEN3293275.1 hypothetical protein [Yersinia enterocolitica]HEN3467033.1 hypothetical protein [Yersinia enterocolitica]
MAIYRLPEQLEQLSDEQSAERQGVVKTELDALDVVISYAEERRRSASAFQRRGYEELFRHGFGKTVVIDTQYEGRQVLRISQASSDYANTTLGYATPNSPKGHLCRIARLGQEFESEQWGRYTIVEIRNFARFTGIEAAKNTKNFQVMESNSLAVKNKNGLQTVVNNLKLALQRWYRPKQHGATDVVQAPLQDIRPSAIGGHESENWLDLQLDQDHELYLEETEEQFSHYDIYGRSDEDRDDYIGLSNYFFLNPTPEQLRVMTGATTTGPMLVEGVAGSGKTCVALGRAKTLCDLARTTEEDHYNADFIDESSVGFVRTGELVKYLKASCQELHIDKLPIEEYRSLVYRLNNVRQLEQRPAVTTEQGEKVTRAKYQNIAEALSCNFSAETTMKWLHATSDAIGELIHTELQNHLESLNIPDELLTSGFLAKPGTAEGLLSQAKQKLTAEYAPLLHQLSGKSGDTFRLDKIISRLINAQERVEHELFDKNTQWMQPAPDRWMMVKEAKTAINTLREMHAALMVVESVRDNTGRLGRKATEIMVEDYSDLLNLFKQNAVIYSEDGLNTYTSEDVEIIWALRAELTLICDLPPALNRIKIIWAKDFDAINIHLINRKLCGFSQQRTFSLSESNPYMRKIEIGEEKASTSLASRFRAQLQRVYSRWQFADLYRDALLSLPDRWNAFSSAKEVGERLKSKNIAEHDKDLLLAIAHIMTREAAMKSRFERFQEQPYYPSVFIDEVQDFTEIQVFLMAQQADPKYHAITLVGDMHQQLVQGNVYHLEDSFPYQPLAKFLLKENKRQEREPQLAATSMLFRAMVQKDVRLQESPEQLMQWREQAQEGKNKQFIDLPFADVDTKLINLISEQPHGRTIAVICPDLTLASELESRVHLSLIQQSSRTPHVAEQIDLAKKYQIHFSSAENVKGLEFDTMIYVGLEKINWFDKHELNKVYVTISRPRKRLIMFGQRVSLPEIVAACLLTHSERRSA